MFDDERGIAFSYSRIEKRCLEGVNRLLARKVAVFNFFKLKWSFSTSLHVHNTYQASMIRVYEKQKVKHASCNNVKGWDWSVQTQFGDTEIFLSVVPIGGAIVHPR